MWETGESLCVFLPSTCSPSASAEDGTAFHLIADKISGMSLVKSSLETPLNACYAGQATFRLHRPLQNARCPGLL